jgi:alpha,alpha-trehalase
MEEKYKKSLEYIEKYWKKITFYFPKDVGFFIGMPNRSVSPNPDLFNHDQYYWDSYFIILGLVCSGKIKLAKGIVDNFVYLYKRFGIIPTRNRFYNLDLSQIPFLTSMILEVFQFTKDKTWLKKTIKTAEKELKYYWKDKAGKIGEHLVYKGLSRYCDRCASNRLSEHESGWDMTWRFNERCLDYLPIDLNSCLYKYEIDLAEIYEILGEKIKQKHYLFLANKRKKTISKLMWNEKKGFFFDYNYKTKKQSAFYSMAGFYPLWANLASKTQAEKIKNNLKKFEYKGGLVNTTKNNFKKFKQWDYPNGWANQQWIAIKGLMNYGYEKDAKRLAQKWLNLNAKVFKKTGKFWEKYDVVKCNEGKSGRYKNQTGFGWTNAIFVKLIKEFY